MLRDLKNPSYLKNCARFPLMKRLLLCLLVFSGSMRAEDSGDGLAGYFKSLASASQKALGKDGGNRFFYMPSGSISKTPTNYNYKYEDVTFPALDGAKLNGWFLPAMGVKKAKGTVVFSHGNAGALGHHFGFVSWYVRAGYNVLMYDYRGFGKSKGEISRAGVVNDVEAAFRYVKTRKDVDATRLISYGHSLGGASSITALGRKKMEGLRAVISFAGFASYRDMAQKIAGDWGASVVTDELSPRDFVAKISPVPILIVHGDADGVVPFSQGKLLFKNASEPKTFMPIKGGNHQQALWQNDEKYRKEILKWLDDVMNAYLG